MDELSRNTFEMVARSFSNLERTLHENSLALHIKSYDGTDPSLCRHWIDEIEKWAHNSQAVDEDKKNALFITAKKTVSDFIQRYIDENPDCTWLDLRKEVLSNFANISDAAHALDELHNVKQEKDESLSVFLERLRTLSLDAFQEINLEEEGANKLSQRQLVNVFIDGLQSDRIKRKILACECQDLNTAARIAKKELKVERKMNFRVPHQLPK